MIPVYQNKPGCDMTKIGKPTTAMYMKMLPAYEDNDLFEAKLKELDIEYRKNFKGLQGKALSRSRVLAGVP